MFLTALFATNCLDTSFNDRVIDLFLSVRNGTAKPMTEEEGKKQGFMGFHLKSNYVSFDNRYLSRRTEESELKFSTKDSQDKLVGEIAAKLQKGFSESRVSVRGNMMLSNSSLPYKRYIAVEALVDHVLSLDNSMTATINFFTGNIDCGSSRLIEPKHYIRIGPHLTDAKIKEICAAHGVTNYRIERVWYPYNFVFWKRAEERHVGDLAVATFAIFTEAGKPKTALMNDAGDYSDEMNMYSWKEKDSFMPPPRL